MYGWFPKRVELPSLHLFKREERMYKIIVFFLLFHSLLWSESYEEKFWKDKEAHAKGLSLYSDIGYSSYVIELDSSEMNSAIDYNVLEYTLGLSYSYDRWMWGVYGKMLLNELSSNMFVITTQKPLNDNAKIDKDEYGIYSNYVFSENSMHQWGVNFIYRYAQLKGKDSYETFLSYQSNLSYLTHGIALSLVYVQALSKKSSLVLKLGAVYSRAEVEMSESVNQQLQDSYVDDRVYALGTKMGLGYNYRLNKNFFLTSRIDGWKSNFASLSVQSRVGDSLPSASLREASLTSYTGLTWKF